MIKSSDKSFDNTYRILRVLSNQDYLAVDQSDSRFIFSQSKIAARTQKESDIYRGKNADSKDGSHLLKHQQIIEIDHLQYAVFKVGQNEVLWAPLQNKKKLNNEAYVAQLVRQSIQNILKELIWIGCNQAKKYMDMRNFWTIKDELFLLLLPRQQKKVNYSIKKSEKHSHSMTLELVIQSEKALMKEFALILWQICFQNIDYEQKVHNHSSTREILSMMIKKEIGFEYLLNQLSKQKTMYSSERKRKFKTITHQDIFQRRKTLFSIERTNKSSHQYLNKSKMQRKSIVVTQTAINHATQLKDSQLSSQTKWLSLGPEKRSASQDSSAINERNIRFRQTKYQHRLSTHSSTKDTIYYENWLQKKKYSHEIREKLIKNSQVAMKKFIETIQKEREQNIEQKIVDKKMKEKVLSRVLKFKNAFKDKYSSVSYDYSRFEEIRSTDAYQARKVEAGNHLGHQIQLSSQSQQRQFDFKLAKISQDFTLSQSKNNQQPHHKQNKEANQQKLPQIPIFPLKGQTQQSKHKDSNIIRKSETETNSMKTEKNKMKRIDVVDSISNEAELDLEVVQLPQCKAKINDKQQRLISSSQVPATSFGKADEHLHEFLMMINTLGDITVRAVKSKDYLNELNWRQATYYLYERFQVERKLFVANLSSSKFSYRKHRKVDISDEKAFMASLARQNLYRQVEKENEQIAATLAKLGLKLLEEEKMQSKIEYFIRNRQKIAVKNEQKLRKQLSKLLMGCIINQFDYVYEEKIRTPQVLTFLIDCIFGMYVVAQLDNMIPASRFIALDEYKQYTKDLPKLKSMVDYIDGIYFPSEDASREAR